MRGFAAHGRTVIFATHYLEEADAYADRVVLMARGGWWPTARPPRSRPWSASATSGRPCPESTPTCWRALPGVTGAERHGETVILTCSDSDAAIRALLERYHDARDIEITGAGLEQAFLALTGDRAQAAVSEEAA